MSLLFPLYLPSGRHSSLEESLDISVVSQSQQLAGSEFPHRPAVWVFLRLDRRDAVESKGTGVLVVSRDIQGIGALVVFVGSLESAALKAERMETGDKWGSPPPETTLCSAAHQPPAV